VEPSRFLGSVQNLDPCEGSSDVTMTFVYVFRLHRMHEMETTVTDVRSVCLSHGSTRLRCAKMAERIKILFAVNTLGGPRNIVIDGVLIPRSKGGDSMQPSTNYFGLWFKMDVEQKLCVEYVARWPSG